VVLAPAIGRGFVHEPKTGGTWWSRLLLGTPGARLIHEQHDPHSVLTEEERASVSWFGSVRPPVEWYGSAWEHAMMGDSLQRRQLAIWGGGSTDFRDVLMGWTSGAVPAEVAHRPGVLWWQKGACPWVEGEGLWSYARRYFFGDIELVPLSGARQFAEGLGLDAGSPVLNHRSTRSGGARLPESYIEAYTPAMLAAVERADGMAA